jgi:hypothetical protein
MIMRLIDICLLRWDGTVEWRTIYWGKKNLDIHRKDGDIILYTERGYV